MARRESVGRVVRDRVEPRLASVENGLATIETQLDVSERLAKTVTEDYNLGLEMINSAVRLAMAIIVIIGLTPGGLGKTLPSPRKRPSTS